MDFRNLIKDSINDMSNDVRIIRLTFITTFFHSLIVILTIIINLNTLLSKTYENGLYLGKVAEYFIEDVNRNKILTIVLITTSILFLTYSIIYPIGQSAIIHYLKDRKGIKSAIRKGIKNFFPMFEFSFVSLVSSPAVFWIFLFRILILGLDISIIGRIALLIWFAGFSFFNMIKSYTRYYIALENLSLTEALKKSYQTNIKEVKVGMKYMRIQTILLINFTINMLLMLGIPFVLIYKSISWGIIDFLRVKIIIYIIFFLMIFAGAYMSNFVRAFFAYFWYRLYLRHKN